MKPSFPFIIPQPSRRLNGKIVSDRSSGAIRNESNLNPGRIPTIIVGVDFRKDITVEPDKRGGKPCIRGLRITVYDILDYFAAGMTEDQVLKDFPDLTAEDIRAALAFAADRERKLTSLPA